MNNALRLKANSVLGNEDVYKLKKKLFWGGGRDDIVDFVWLYA